MAHKNQQLLRANKPLLPATDARDGVESHEDGLGITGGSAGRQPKRAKVTAVACQPCQKRKSKCDGRRPMCSSCQQKGRNDCVYDSSSDLRRTSALKQKIDTLQQEATDLKDIILAICAAHAAGNIDSVLGVVQSSINPRDFSKVSELAQVLRDNQRLGPATQAQFQQHGDLAQTAHSFGRFQRISQGFGGNYQGLMDVQTSSTGEDRSNWPVLDGGHEQADGSHSHSAYPDGYIYHP